MVNQDPQREKVLAALIRAREQVLADAPTFRPQPAAQLKAQMAAIAQSLQVLEQKLSAADLAPAWDAIAALARELSASDETWQQLAHAAAMAGWDTRQAEASSKAHGD